MEHNLIYTEDYVLLVSDELPNDKDLVLWMDETIDKFTFNTSDENSDGWIGDSVTGCSVKLDDCKK